MGLEINDLTPRRADGALVVDDPDGGTWIPSEEAVSMIEAASNPEAEAVRLCMEAPVMGRWLQ